MTSEIEADDVVMGTMLREAREKLGLSVMRLHKMSGLGRRLIDDAEKGKNIGTFGLRKLMRTLGMKSVTFGGDMTIRYAAGGIAPGVVIEAAREIEKGAALVLSAVETLKVFGADHNAKAGGEMSARAAALARRLADRLTNATADELEDLEQRLLLDKEPSAAPATRRRKRTA